MRVKKKNGKFASKASAIFRFCNRTGLDEAAYYKWASECGDKASINAKDRKLCEKYGLESIAELVDYKPMYFDDDMTLSAEELSGFVLDNCQNPAEMAAAYLEVARQWKDYEDKNDFIEANLSKFPKASFERWSDKNLIGQVSGSWFDSKGIPLDVQAEAMTEAFYVEISIQDIVEHITTYKRGKYVNTQKTLVRMYWDKTEELCGFKVNEKYMEHLAGVLVVESENIDESPLRQAQGDMATVTEF
ncbi:MAG TPA: hypothetical protein VK175_06295 [Leadbetterella sp.]|nr:hypothetical protein [Leadbetterella sp.]